MGSHKLNAGMNRAKQSNEISGDFAKAIYSGEMVKLFKQKVFSCIKCLNLKYRSTYQENEQPGFCCCLAEKIVFSDPFSLTINLDDLDKISKAPTKSITKLNILPNWCPQSDADSSEEH